MTTIDRRGFLRMAGAAATASLIPQSIRDALAIPAYNRTGSIMDVQHVVILMQENRSFDHYFGTLPGVRGFGDRITIPLPEGRSVWEQRYETAEGSRTILPYHLDSRVGNAQRVTGTPHSWGNAQPAWDNGRMDRWPTSKEPQSMGYYQQQELEFQFALANAFTLCDQYHCAFHGGTNTNRLFHWTGTNDPAALAGGPAISNQWDSLGPSSEGYGWRTYPEQLQDAGVSWKVYQNLPDNFTDNPLSGFQQYRVANEQRGNDADGSPYPAYTPSDEAINPLYKGVANTMPRGNVLNPSMLNDFAADVSSGRLPQVSWIVAPANYSEHPGPSSPVQGAWYIQEVLKALTSDPEVWSKTVLLVNFDENDGFFDHVPPPGAPSLNADGSMAGKSTVNTLSERYIGEEFRDRVFGPGPRVPLYVISPWSRGGWVNSQTFDHTSILRFLEQRFNVFASLISPWRRMACGDLMSAFNFVDPNGDLPQALPERGKLEADLIRYGQEVRGQVPVPTADNQSLPVQPRGVRPSRALPYELHASAAADADRNRLRLLFGNTGRAGAVFHVYDKLHLDRLPRRYGVDAGRTLDDFWELDADGGRYDLWVLAANGWHRHFVGDVSALRRGGAARPEILVCYEVTRGDVYLKLRNHGQGACRFRLSANAYQGPGVAVVDVPAGGEREQHWNLQGSGGWYDFTVSTDNAAEFTRRFAGRVETGRPSISDPEMGNG